MAEFEPLLQLDTDASADLALALSVVGYGSTELDGVGIVNLHFDLLAPFDAEAALGLVLDLRASASPDTCIIDLPAFEIEAAGVEIVPNVSVGFLTLGLETTGTGSFGGSGEAILDVGLETLATATDAAGFIDLDIGTFAQEAPELVENYVLALQSPGYMVAYGGWALIQLAETMEGVDGTDARLVVLLREVGWLQATASPILSTFHHLTDVLASTEAIDIMFPVLLAETLRGNDVLTAIVGLSLAEQMVASEVMQDTLTAHLAIAEVLTALDALDAGLFAHLTETSESAETIAYIMDFWVQLIEAVRGVDTVTGSPILTVFLADTGESVETLLPGLTAAVILRESLGALLNITINGDTYTAWAVNTNTREATQYTGYHYNSFAQINGKWYGCTGSEIRRLEGDTDDGDAIAWRLRSGLTTFGKGQKKKRLPSVYLGYTATGQVVLKVLSTSSQDANAVLDEHWYALPTLDAGVIRQSRFKPGRGIQGVYLGFELAGEGPMGLDVVELFPLILDRRV